jgi:hypothetical protein|tara:strand:+ start:840 stop:1004 length:165 start_codon:yes stop_codon:yes gene_type:complete
MLEITATSIITSVMAVVLIAGGLVISYKWSMYVFSKGGKHEGSGDGTLGVSRRR